MHNQELATVLLNYLIGRFVLSSLCVGDLLRLGLSSVRVAVWSTTQLCFRLQHGSIMDDG